MHASFAPVSIRIDLESFGGPAHYMRRFHNGAGWLIMARASEAGGSREAYITAACDECGHGHPSFQVAHLLDCAWSLPEPCDGYAPDELEELLDEEHGTQALRWLRADYRELRQVDEASEAALGRQEQATQVRIDRIDRHLADLRRRRRSPGMSFHNLATIDATIIELSDLRDRETAAFARARRVLRADTAAMEERFLAQSGLRVELEITLVAHWRACVTPSVTPPRVNWHGGTHGTPEAHWLYAELGDPEAQARRHTAASMARLSLAIERSASKGPSKRKNGHKGVAATSEPHRFTEPRALPRVAPVVPRPSCSDAQLSTAMSNVSAGIVPGLGDTGNAISDLKGDTANWSPDQEALLRRLWGEGASARTIASALRSMSRNAAVNKAKRLKLPLKPLVTEEPLAKPASPSKNLVASASSLKALQAKLDGRLRVLAHVERLSGSSEDELRFWEKRKSALKDEIEILAAQRAAVLAGQE